MFRFLCSHVWATCRHSNHSPTRSGTPYPRPFRLRGAIVWKRFPTNCTRPPVRSKARAWSRCLFTRCPHATGPWEALLREPTLHASESGSPKVPSSHRFPHTVRLGGRKASVAGGRRWPSRVDFFSFVVSHVWATCRHSNHSPTRAGTPYPRPFRLRGAIVRKRFPTNCTRPPVRSKARAWSR